MACDGVFVCFFLYRHFDSYFYFQSIRSIHVFSSFFSCYKYIWMCRNRNGFISCSLSHFYGSHFNDTFADTFAVTIAVAADAAAFFSVYVIPRKTTNCHHIYIVIYK